MRQFTTVLFDAKPVTASLSSVGIGLINMEGFSVSASYTGTVVGTLKLEASVDDETYTAMSDTVQSVAGVGTSLWNVPFAYYPYVRLTLTRTSGTGVISAKMFARGPS